MEKNTYSREQKNTVFVSVVTSFITTFMGSALNLAVPGIEQEFDTNALTVGWIVTIYMLTCGALAVPAGRFADIFKRKRILQWGILIFAISSLAAIFSFNIWLLLIFRMCQGVGASMIFSTNIAILAAAFEEKMRGKILGYSTSATYIGLSAGPVLGGIITHNFGWRGIFVASGIVSIITFVMALKKLPEEVYNKENCVNIKTEGIHWKSVIIYIFSLVLIMYGLSILSTKKTGPFILVAGIGLFVIFVLLQKKSRTPLIKTKLFENNRAFLFSNGAALINYGATFIVSYLISVYLQVILGFSSQKAGIILIVSPVIMSLFSPVTGKLSDKVSPHLLSGGGMALCACALFLFGIFIDGTSLIGIILILALTGSGLALFSAPNTNAVMTRVPREDYGTATSILSTMRSVGHTFAMALVTLIMGVYLGHNSLREVPADLLTDAISICFFIFAALCIIGIFMAIKKKV